MVVYLVLNAHNVLSTQFSSSLQRKRKSAEPAVEGNIEDSGKRRKTDDDSSGGVVVLNQDDNQTQMEAGEEGNVICLE